MSYELFAEYYDELTGNVDYDARAAYIDALIKQYKPDAHLLVDLACGTGSMTVKFAAMGYDVIGVDLSEDMLSKAREKSDGSILYLCQSLQELDMYGTIDAFVCQSDFIALGICAAVGTAYSGKHPVITGYGCSLPNVKSILSGTQSMSVYKSSMGVARLCASAVNDLLSGKKLSADTNTDNGAIRVPTLFVSPVVITKDNYSVLISDGLFSTGDLG